MRTTTEDRDDLVAKLRDYVWSIAIGLIFWSALIALLLWGEG